MGTKEGERVLIDRVFAVMNTAQGYLYDPGGASPEGEERKFFSRATGGGGFACGPKLAYIRGPVSVKTQDVLSAEGF